MVRTGGCLFDPKLVKDRRYAWPHRLRWKGNNPNEKSFGPHDRRIVKRAFVDAQYFVHP
jgi:hypothetical protein